MPTEPFPRPVPAAPIPPPPLPPGFVWPLAPPPPPLPGAADAWAWGNLPDEAAIPPRPAPRAPSPLAISIRQFRIPGPSAPGAAMARIDVGPVIVLCVRLDLATGHVSIPLEIDGEPAVLCAIADVVRAHASRHYSKDVRPWNWPAPPAWPMAGPGGRGTIA